MTDIGFRPPTAREQEVLNKLAASPFVGAGEIRDQLRSLQVREVDENGSLTLDSATGSDAPVTERIPVEGESVDSDGVKVHILLHVVGGRLTELEIFKEDGSKVLQPPTASELTIITSS
jgi:hypothetical protein